MDNSINKYMDRQIDGQMNRQILYLWIDEYVDRLINVNRWIIGKMDNWIDKYI